jgi:hypothetical protein
MQSAGAGAHSAPINMPDRRDRCNEFRALWHPTHTRRVRLAHDSGRRSRDQTLIVANHVTVAGVETAPRRACSQFREFSIRRLTLSACEGLESNIAVGCFFALPDLRRYDKFRIQFRPDDGH